MPTAALQGLIWKNRGLFTETLLYESGSTSPNVSPKPVFRSGTIRVDSNGTMAISKDTAAIPLIDKLHSCSLQVIEHGVINIKSFDLTQSVSLKPSNLNQFNTIFAAVVLWQSLKPRGISHKRILSPYKVVKTSENLLVANCKIFGFVPKLKNLELLPNGPRVTLSGDTKDDDYNGGWFSAMVVLKSDGIIKLINESDGQQIYSIDVKKLRSAEIRELHHSLFESWNLLYIGIIEGLRKEGIFPNSAPKSHSIPNISPEYGNKVNRIILEFPYRIDVEDWLVALTSFTIKEHVGLDKSNSLRVSRKVKLGILEASYNGPIKPTGLYVEVRLWNKPWFRTSVVSHTADPFFREEFQLDLPISTTTVTILLKNSKNSKNYHNHDEILGSSVIDYKKLRQNVPHDKISIYHKSEQVGHLSISSEVSRNYILPAENFNNFETMVLNLKFPELYNFVVPHTTNMDLENVSIVLLDFFQSVNKDKEWINSLIEKEVTTALSKGDAKLSNTIFRGNSILTKSVEILNLRIGQEYLEEVIGKFVNSLISNFKPIEIDPVRIKDFNSEEEKLSIIDTNFDNLLKLVKEVWKRIYLSSNDLPSQIKTHLSYLRKSLELYANDESTILNPISSFIFLRFFCPVILNPKLFFLTKDHQFGDIKRCLTLLSKIVMKFANLQEFDAKDPYLLRFNDEFILKYREELLDYLDKITLKKMDFSSRHLKLSSSLERSQVPMYSGDSDKDSLTVPFLIDKYLRIDQLVDIFTKDPSNTDAEDEGDPIIDDFGTNEVEVPRDHDGHGQEHKDESYSIGSLEFEKLILDEKDKSSDSFEFGSEKFIKALLNTDKSEEVFQYINSNSSLKDLVTEAKRLLNKRNRLIRELSCSETFNSVVHSAGDVKKILSTTVIDTHGNVRKTRGTSTSLKSLQNDVSLSQLKLKFDNSSGINEKSSTKSYGNLTESNRSNQLQSPTKKLGNIIRSASINTISTLTNAFDDTSPSPSKKKTLAERFFKR